MPGTQKNRSRARNRTRIRTRIHHLLISRPGWRMRQTVTHGTVPPAPAKRCDRRKRCCPPQGSGAEPYPRIGGAGRAGGYAEVEDADGGAKAGAQSMSPPSSLKLKGTNRYPVPCAPPPRVVTREGARRARTSQHHRSSTHQNGSSKNKACVGEGERVGLSGWAGRGGAGRGGGSRRRTGS